jgi:hypothetical protein
MKMIAALMALAGLMAGSPALAQTMTADDMKWINQCINDNKGATSDAIIRKYCTCMNDKMDNNETRSISVWEKANPKARAACDKESGWK